MIVPSLNLHDENNVGENFCLLLKMVTAGAENCSSKEGSDWNDDDDFPLTTLQMLERIERENMAQDSGSSSESEKDNI